VARAKVPADGADGDFYFRDGKKYHRVSTILNTVRDPGFEEALKFQGAAIAAKADLSSRVLHPILAEISKGADLDSVLAGVREKNPFLEKMVAAFHRHGLANGWRLIESEKTYFDESYKIAGTPDLIVRDTTGKKILMDFKMTAKISPRYRLQVGAYSWLAAVNGLQVDTTMVMRFDESGLAEVKTWPAWTAKRRDPIWDAMVYLAKNYA